jgi:WD40 repeat protein/transcriptional regulator with XRE-family HTH domain
MSNDPSFGAWLKRRRKELDLTQEELAEAVGCSPDMVGKVEGGSARPSRQLAELLVAHLQVPPDQQSSFVQWARTGHREPLTIASTPTAAASEPSAPSISSTSSISGEADGKADELENPYKGLRAFGEKDALDFFGRETLVERLKARMSAPEELSRFLAVVGPSGSGKSSVVRAGLLPALRQQLLPGGLQPLVVDMVPGTHPLEEIEAAFLRVAVNPPSSLMEQLRDGDSERGLVRAVKRVLPADGSAEMLLVIDQFEELFTLTRNEQERAGLLRNLFEAIRDPSSRLWVVVTLRADFYGHPLQYVPSTELVGKRTEVVGPLTPDELYRAITGPAERSGLSLERDLPVAIIDDVAEQPGALPLMQYALTELFEHREGRLLTLRAYRRSGGVTGALAQRAEELYTGLASAEQREARQLFLRLVTLGEETGAGTEDTRRRARRSEIASAARDEEALGNVLDLYGRYRMLTFDRDPITGGPTVEVAHEALLRSWARLSGWLAENRERLLVHRRLLSAAVEWQRSGQERSFLASGARLAQFAELTPPEQPEAEGERDEATTLALTAEERQYLTASLQEQQRQEEAEREQHARELALKERAANRLRYLVAGLALFLLVAGGLAVWAFNQSQVAQANEQTARASLAHTDALRLSAEVDSLISSHGPNDLAALLIIRSLNIDYTPQADVQLSAATTWTYPAREFVGHTAGVNGIAIAPDGKYLATASTDNTAALWEVATARQLRVFSGYSGTVVTARFSPDGKYLLTSSEDKAVHIWEVATGQSVRVFANNPAIVDNAVFSPDGKRVAASVEDGIARVWDIASGQIVLQIRNPGYFGVAYSPDGKYLATGGVDHIARIWDASSGQLVQTLTGPSDNVNDLAFSPDSKSLLGASDDSTARIWDIATGQTLHVLTGHTGGTGGVAFSPDGKLAATGSADHAARLWDVSTGQLVQTLSGHNDAVGGVAFSPDGKWLATASADHTARLWPVQAAAGSLVVAGHANSLGAASFSPDGKYIATGSVENNMARLWDAATGRELRQFSGHTDWVTTAVFSPDGKTLLTSSRDATARLWDAATGKQLMIFTGHTARVDSAYFSPDGKTIVTASEDKTARLWDVATGRELLPLTGHTDFVNKAVFSPDGKTVLTGSSDGTARLWDAATDKELRRFTGHSGAVRPSFSPDGKTMVTAGDDGTVRLWDVASEHELRRFGVPGVEMDGADFSPDGSMVVAGGHDEEIWVWDVRTGQELRRFKGQGGNVNSVAFSPDGKQILAANNDSTVRLWPTDYHDSIRVICAELTRDLTPDERSQYGITDQGPSCPAH